MFKLELRLALECKTCEQLVDAVPSGMRPKDPLTGRLNLEAVIAMGLCPTCLTPIDSYLIDWKKIMSRYRRRHRMG